ncbi:MAG: ABC transporter ATP-binding protein [Candidatus Liberibacter europaeus]|uniref:ABC transporter ATP-binding protein n=1 Tax=Candidatus Liberibacter europaeus TaxID=744859 RepID=A0A2T4VY90_9HYPH|nr:ABC transporter ATP-binding protein [Candidatus Liberibacter europaeus]PTL86734.1 MAG: ABC transporter ATP-binding protein [Candidatus Liberibacter europaeus]
MSNINRKKDEVLSVQNLTVRLNNKTILKNINLDILRGEIIGVIGPSGVGKSILMRAILGLIPYVSGRIKFLKQDFTLPGKEYNSVIGTKLGILFQHGALFSSMTVQENISAPIREHLNLPDTIIKDIVKIKMSLVGLPLEIANLIPYQLSGGMVKRVALARSLAVDPELIFLDEPTSGLDPIGAAEFDDLIIKLHNSLGLTVYMITHDINSLVSTCNKVIIMRKTGIMYEGTVTDMLSSSDPWIKSYFGRFARGFK